MGSLLGVIGADDFRRLLRQEVVAIPHIAGYISGGANKTAWYATRNSCHNNDFKA
jgi:hypothetical protein